MNYAEIVQWFKPRNEKKICNLEPMREACCYFDAVEKAFPCVHVAGTNGKGSTCFKIARAFRKAGYKVGLYTSPHISSLCERIQINNDPIPEQELARLVSLIRAYDSSLSGFEVMTLAAFLWYRESHVDFAVLEVGLGGRFDATNVCYPNVSVITSISFDHMESLGTTLASIADNKAGIIKENTPVVIGPRVPYDVIARRATEAHAPLYQVSGYFEDYDEENSCVAREVLRILQKKWQGLDIEDTAYFRPPCRFEEVVTNYAGGPRVILDVAHNPDGIDKLLKKLQQKAVFLCSISKDKDVQTMLKLILGLAEGIICTQAPCPRTTRARDLGKIALDLKPSVPVGIEEDMGAAFEAALLLAQEKGVPLVVTGTFYLMDHIKRLLIGKI